MAGTFWGWSAVLNPFAVFDLVSFQFILSGITGVLYLKNAHEAFQFKHFRELFITYHKRNNISCLRQQK